MSAQTTESHELGDLVPGVSSITRSITHAAVIKEGDIFFLSEADGSVPLVAGHGFGLYYHDCRYLGAYEFRIGGRKPESLVRNSARENAMVLGLTNNNLRMPDGTQLAKHQVEIKWSRSISCENLSLDDTFTFHNLSPQAVETNVELIFRPSFEDIFTIRGLFPGARGTLNQPEHTRDGLCLSYDGADQVLRKLMISFDPLPVECEAMQARFVVRMKPKDRCEIRVRLVISETETGSTASAMPKGTKVDDVVLGKTTVETDSLIFNRLMERSMRDLEMLRSRVAQQSYFAAGVPWFVALFGRDSLITALQMLAFEPMVAEQTIRLLAAFQGKAHNPWREEQPGKILHELRVGEMARLNEVPHTPYYGSVDATPLWLILLGQHALWTGRLELFRELEPNVGAALNWLDTSGDMDGDGFSEYHCNIEKGLANQGWKDSGDCIVHLDGTLADPPIALVEMQAYIYRAKLDVAALYEKSGHAARAVTLRKEAQELKIRFNREYWTEGGHFALALQAGKKQVKVLSSNAGHALWAGVADEDKARETALHLMGPEMFNGWGIRTLSAREVGYNPMGYHVGTVWPHDCSMIAEGFRRYGHDAAAVEIASGLIDAAMHFEGYRLPELFGGFHRDDYGVPVSYPVACQPQAWAAGTFPYLLTSLLGLHPDAFAHQLKVVRPVLPINIKRVEFHGLRVGDATADLLFERDNASIHVKVLQHTGELSVSVEL